MLYTVTRRFIMQKARSQTFDVLELIVSKEFQSLFTTISGYFSPFPHGTGSLSVTDEYLALEGGPPIFKQDTVSRPTRKGYIK